MKKTMMMLMVGMMFAGSVGCSSAPKQEEATDTTISADTSAEEQVEKVEEPAKSDLSLGAGSSGRGH